MKQTTAATQRQDMTGKQAERPGRARYHFLLESGEAMDEYGLEAYLSRRAGKAGDGTSNPPQD